MLKLNDGYRDLVSRVEETYHNDKNAPSRSQCKIVASRLQAACEDVRELVNKRIIDLGCGSMRSKDHPPLWMWALSGFRKIDTCLPWYCRIAHLAKAQVLGIDVSPNKKEPFPSLQADLTDDATFRPLPDGSLDIANNMRFTARPDNKYGHHAFSPHLKKTIAEPEDLYRYDAYVFAQVERLLREGGRYTLMDEVYQKRNGRLQIIGNV